MFANCQGKQWLVFSHKPSVDPDIRLKGTMLFLHSRNEFPDALLNYGLIHANCSAECPEEVFTEVLKVETGLAQPKIRAFQHPLQTPSVCRGRPRIPHCCERF